MSADCATGLVCWQVYTGTLGVLFGTCDYENFGLTPTGKTCTAECASAADCLEIPIPDQAGPPIYRSCQDLTKAIGSDTCGQLTTLQRECFLYKTYCDSTANPWTCTSGSCSYTGACLAGKTGEVVGGCPAYTRSGVGLAVSVCNATSLKCAAAATTGCKSDAECDTKAVADDGTDTCSAGECVCHVTSGGCYRRCRNDLECAHGYVCGTSQYCVAGPTCDSDAFCATSKGIANEKCVQGVCKAPCVNDLGCNDPIMSKGNPSFNGQVCHSGYCEAIGCSSSSECSTISSGKNVNMFCQTPPAASTTAAPVSAITN